MKIQIKAILFIIVSLFYFQPNSKNELKCLQLQISHKNDLHSITSHLRGHLPIFGNENPDVHVEEKGGQKGK